MVLCFVAGCNNNSNRNATSRSYFRIPQNKARIYYDIARRADISKSEFLASSYKRYRICDAHFEPGDINHLPGGKVRLGKDALPRRIPLLEVSIN